MLKQNCYAQYEEANFTNARRNEVNPRAAFASRRKLAWVLLLASAIFAAPYGSTFAQNTNYVRAFYYDSNDTLLLVEDTTSGVDWSERTLVKLSPPPAPIFDGTTKPSQTCNFADPQLVPGASYAIYYGTQGNRGKAMPMKRENTIPVSRKVNCTDSGDNACPPGTFCMCKTSCTTTCCY